MTRAIRASHAPRDLFSKKAGKLRFYANLGLCGGMGKGVFDR